MNQRLPDRARVLVMDDDDLIRKALGWLLEDLGFEPVPTPDGTSTLELFKKAHSADKPFKVAILDYAIPGGMNGVEILERLREIDPAIKAIVTSGYANAPIMAHYEEHGFQGKLAKPFTLTELSTVLKEVLESK